jgi:arylsulfatase A-like enzyme
MARSSSSRPNVLLIVLDCARSDLFDSELARPGAMPVLRALEPEVLTFPGAVSPSSWTIPGHASLFTGLYPWDHGAHYRLGPILTREPETLAEFLRTQGYATAFYSANAYVQASTGLTRGFDEALWGGGREFYLRFLSIAQATCTDLGGPALVWLPPKPGGERPSPLRDFGMTSLSRLPGVWDGMNRVAGRMNGTYGGAAQEVCSWIEPELGAWLGRQPIERPTFAFVNLFEAHEPYLAEAGHPVGLKRWLRYARSTQDPVLWVNGHWDPTPSEIAISRSAYLRALSTMDRRIGRIVELYRQHHRWESTLFILTSDHGQAFLEHDTLYHRFRVNEPVARIPLWIRAPSGEPHGSRSDLWASLVDVPRTIASLLGRDSFGDPSSCSLLESDDRARARSVYSMSDGIPAAEAPTMSAERRKLLDRLDIAAYRGDLKAIVSEEGMPRAFRVSPSRAEIDPPAAEAGPETSEVIELARSALELTRARIASREYHGSVERRIAGWGY